MSKWNRTSLLVRQIEVYRPLLVCTSNNSGFSLIELMVVLALVSLMGSGMVYFGETMMSSTHLSESSSRLNTFLKNAQMKAKYQKNCVKLEYSSTQSKFLTSYFDNSLDCGVLVGPIANKSDELLLNSEISVAGVPPNNPIVILRNGSLMATTDRSITLSSASQTKTVKILGLTGKVSIQ